MLCIIHTGFLGHWLFGFPHKVCVCVCAFSECPNSCHASQTSVIATPCHTKGHVVFFVEPQGPGAVPALFSGDTLFVGGCGRFFEGTANQMYDNLVQKIARLPDETLVFCAHEYTESNLSFALQVAAPVPPNCSAVPHRPRSCSYPPAPDLLSCLLSTPHPPRSSTSEYFWSHSLSIGHVVLYIDWERGEFGWTQFSWVKFITQITAQGFPRSFCASGESLSCPRREYKKRRVSEDVCAQISTRVRKQRLVLGIRIQAWYSTCASCQSHTRVGSLVLTWPSDVCYATHVDKSGELLGVPDNHSPQNLVGRSCLCGPKLSQTEVRPFRVEGWGDCPGPRKGTSTRRNVTQGGGVVGFRAAFSGSPQNFPRAFDPLF